MKEIVIGLVMILLLAGYMFGKYLAYKENDKK